MGAHKMFIMLLKACQYEYLADTHQRAARKQSGPRCDGKPIRPANQPASQTARRPGEAAICADQSRLRNQRDIRVYLAAPVASGGQVFSLNTNYPMGSWLIAAGTTKS